ncbi:MAG: hypothetical protein ACOCRK_09390 [bacterium]
MSFYNIFFGKNINTDVIMALIGLKECDVQRFRNCGIDYDNEEIYVYTRTGGGNRSDYPNKALTNNSYYKYDKDDSFDCTYATYYFRFPEEIKADINKLQNVLEHGISVNLIQWLNKTFQRKPNKNDKYIMAYKKQMNVIKILQRDMQVSKVFNGHTIIPLTDRGMNHMLKVIEENNGKFIAYWNFLPYKFKVIQNDFEYDFYRKKGDIEGSKARLAICIVWEIDTVAWERYKKKYADKYPKSIAKMQEKIDKEII